MSQLVPIRTEDGAVVGGLAPLADPGVVHYAASRCHTEVRDVLLPGTIVLRPVSAAEYQALSIQRYAQEQLHLDLALQGLFNLINRGQVNVASGSPLEDAVTLRKMMGSGSAIPCHPAASDLLR